MGIRIADGVIYSFSTGCFQCFAELRTLFHHCSVCTSDEKLELVAMSIICMSFPKTFCSFSHVSVERIFTSFLITHILEPAARHHSFSKIAGSPQCCHNTLLRNRIHEDRNWTRRCLALSPLNGYQSQAPIGIVFLSLFDEVSLL